MFTPPPSPLPAPMNPFDAHPSDASSSSSPSSSPVLAPLPVDYKHLALSAPPKRRHRSNASFVDNQDRKQRTGRWIFLSILVVPLVLTLITLSTRYAAHLAVLDFLSGSLPEPHPAWNRHAPLVRRQTPASVATLSETQAQVSSVLFPSATTSASSAAPTATDGISSSPTIPTIPASTPAIPTPFPQPFDTTMIQNFSTTDCQSFVSNMTGSPPFRQCRAFSFLSQTSSEFLEAQTNVSQLNIDLWGTCNTPQSAEQCSANMGWFAQQIQQDCAQDLSNQNPLVVQSLASLRTYDLFRQVACLADENTNAYCYIEAAANSNPADLYVYSLPFGSALPNSVTVSCSTCTKRVMALFGQKADQVDGLKTTFNSAANFMNGQCGAGYVQVAVGLPDSSLALMGIPRVSWGTLALVGLVGLFGSA